MTRIYLDVNDRVCVDKTPDSREARDATFNRGLLGLGALQERMALLAIELREARGRDTTESEANLAEVRTLCCEIHTEAYRNSNI